MSEIQQIYCPYVGRLVPVEQTNREHVIPLALGGCNEFTLPVEAQINSRLGNQIDGKLASDFLVMQRRNRLDIRGHSGERPVPTYKKGTIGTPALPVQVEIDQAQLAFRVFSPRHGRYLTEEEQAGQKISFRCHLDPRLRLRFVAKVALERRIG